MSCREGAELYRELEESGELKNTVIVFGQMNDPPGARFRVGHAALTMAEYFRDDQHQDVLLLIDNVFRFIQAGSEVSGLMGRLPSRLGYQPTLGTELAELEERICSTRSGAITSVQAVYVPADDFTDPAAVHTFGPLSATIVIVALAIGAVLGAFYFGGLWITVRRVAAAPQPEFLLFASYLLRVGVVLLGFYLVMDGRWERLAACIAGFLLARTLVVRRLRDVEQSFGLPASTVSTKRTTE